LANYTPKTPVVEIKKEKEITISLNTLIEKVQEVSKQEPTKDVQEEKQEENQVIEQEKATHNKPQKQNTKKTQRQLSIRSRNIKKQSTETAKQPFVPKYKKYDENIDQKTKTDKYYDGYKR
jgi:hypothetical protein